MTTKQIRTRFSPSPTGMIHLGNARAALFAALFAEKNNGTFILRIEDSDVTRSKEEYVEAVQNDLHWLGVDWQEGPGVDGDYGPYWQSLRHDIYKKYYAILESKKLMYPCFCTDQELLLARKRQLSNGKPPRYSGKCKNLPTEEVEKLIAEGKQHSWRFIVPEGEAIEFLDTVKGPQRFLSDDIGDFIIRRADGTPPFLFCNAIDDATMNVSHVLRGEDHISNTPRQIMLLKTLGLHIPHYGHLSLIVGDDGAPLSKRHGSSSVDDIRQKGYLPAAIMNYLSHLGHASDVQELLDFNHMAEHFNLEKLSKSPARFDLTQLLYWQKNAVQALSEEDMWKWLGESVSGQVPLKERSRFIETVKANIEFPHDALEWAKIFFHDSVAIDDKGAALIKDAGEQFFVEAEEAVNQYGTDIKQVLAEMKKTLSVSGKKLFMPLRVALTGRVHGPEMANIAELLGKEKMQHRLSRAFKVASEITG